MTVEQLVTMIGIPIILSMATAIGILYKQLITQQRQFEAVIKEVSKLIGTVAELQRQTNSLLVEVKDVMILCNGRRDR